MTDKHAHLYREMSDRAFQLFLKDKETLRNRLSQSKADIARFRINQMKRNQLVNALLANEFSGDAVMSYISQCRQWDELEKSACKHSKYIDDVNNSINTPAGNFDE